MCFSLVHCFVCNACVSVGEILYPVFARVALINKKGHDFIFYVLSIWFFNLFLFVCFSRLSLRAGVSGEILWICDFGLV